MPATPPRAARRRDWPPPRKWPSVWRATIAWRRASTRSHRSRWGGATWHSPQNGKPLPRGVERLRAWWAGSARLTMGSPASSSPDSERPARLTGEQVDAGDRRACDVDARPAARRRRRRCGWRGRRACAPPQVASERAEREDSGAPIRAMFIASAGIPLVVQWLGRRAAVSSHDRSSARAAPAARRRQQHGHARVRPREAPAARRRQPQWT